MKVPIILFLLKYETRVASHHYFILNVLDAFSIIANIEFRISGTTSSERARYVGRL